LKSNFLRSLSIPASLVILIFFVYSCKKDPYQVGLNLLPPSDTLNVKTTDTASIVAHSVLQDSVRTDETTLSILGSLMDPIFGSTTAGLYMQYRLSAEAPDFGLNPTLDSVVLRIPYGSIYGDTNALQNLKVYEISKDFFIDSTYYSNQSLPTYGTLLADYSFTPNRYKKVRIGTDTVAAHIHINLNKLTNYFGNKILHAPVSSLSTNANFITFMKGLYIVSPRTPYGGALLSFDPTDPTNVLSKIVVYFHNATDTGQQHFDVVGNSLCARFNHFDHNHYLNASAELRQQVIQKDTVLGKNSLFIQGLGGIRIRLRLPFLKNFSTANKIAINNAILTFKNAQTDTTLQPPVKLTLVIVDSAGEVAFLSDENEGTGYAGGDYHSVERTYQFRITRHMQAIVDGKIKNYDMYLMANDPTTNVLVTNRVSFTGTKPDLPSMSGDRIRLQVIYTKLH
jgi:hypothetical protein